VGSEKMKIAQISSLWSSTPPNKYGGTELIAGEIVEELVRRKHNVTLYASGDSETSARLKAVVGKSLGPKVENGTIGPDQVIKNEVYNNYLAYSEQNDYDLYHAHSSFLGAAFADFVSAPTIITMHSYPKGPELEILKKSKAKLVSISNNFRKYAPEIEYIGTVYNGINVKKYKFSPNARPDFIAIGRFSPKKGIEIAISTAIKSGVELKIAAPLPYNHPKKDSWLADVSYFEKHIQPFEDNRLIDLVGEIGGYDQKSDFFRGRALISPLQWEEPFGLVMIEAMACGTPIIAYARGSVPEVVKDGETGFIVNSSKEDNRGDWIIKKTGIEGLREAIQRIHALSETEYRAIRNNCRKHVEDNFTTKHMVDGYEKIYRNII
jgi:glycosyltransferase involved in cell wall biosynthesis